MVLDMGGLKVNGLNDADLGLQRGSSCFPTIDNHNTTVNGNTWTWNAFSSRTVATCNSPVGLYL